MSYLISGFFARPKKKPGPLHSRHFGIPAVCVRPVGFPSHSREWFSFVVYRFVVLFYPAIRVAGM